MVVLTRRHHCIDDLGACIVGQVASDAVDAAHMEEARADCGGDMSAQVECLVQMASEISHLVRWCDDVVPNSEGNV